MKPTLRHLNVGDARRPSANVCLPKFDLVIDVVEDIKSLKGEPSTAFSPLCLLTPPIESVWHELLNRKVPLLVFLFHEALELRPVNGTSSLLPSNYLSHS